MKSRVCHRLVDGIGGGSGFSHLHWAVSLKTVVEGDIDLIRDISVFCF